MHKTEDLILSAGFSAPPSWVKIADLTLQIL